MVKVGRLILWLSNLKIAISLLMVIALSSALGTAIPQGESAQKYLDQYNQNPFLGLIKGRLLLVLQLDHIYSSYWFLALLLWLGLALIICSWKRQWPMLKAALKWVDYKSVRQIKKLILAQTIEIKTNSDVLSKLTNHLKKEGWAVNINTNRIAARKGAIGRIGPLLVHLGLILLMIGSIVGVLNGQKIERFIAPGRSIKLISPNGDNQLTLKLNKFEIDRDSLDRPKQFRSKVEINQEDQNTLFKEISVNHPLRFRGITIYQADWSLAAITLQLGTSPKIQFPLSNIPELGEQVWGVIIPTTKEGNNPVLLTVSNEKGPIRIFEENGSLLTTLLPGGEAKDILGTSIKINNILTNSGLILKRDPGVPLVYSGFATTLIGGILSVIATRQLWIILEKEKNFLHIGGLCNRNLSGLANELPKLLNDALED